MELDPLTIFAAGGVASLLIERIFYYKSKYSKKNNPGNYGERIAILEKGQQELEKSNEKDHNLIRADIKKLFNLFNGIRK